MFFFAATGVHVDEEEEFNWDDDEEEDEGVDEAGESGAKKGADECRESDTVVEAGSGAKESWEPEEVGREEEGGVQRETADEAMDLRREEAAIKETSGLVAPIELKQSETSPTQPEQQQQQQPPSTPSLPSPTPSQPPEQQPQQPQQQAQQTEEDGDSSWGLEDSKASPDPAKQQRDASKDPHHHNDNNVEEKAPTPSLETPSEEAEWGWEDA